MVNLVSRPHEGQLERHWVDQFISPGHVMWTDRNEYFLVAATEEDRIKGWVTKPESAALRRWEVVFFFEMHGWAVVYPTSTVTGKRAYGWSDDELKYP